MFSLFLGVMSSASLVISYQWVAKYSLQKEKIGEVEKSSSFIIGEKLVPHAHRVFWFLSYVYHYMIAKVFGDAALLNLLNIMTAILGLIILSRTMYRQVEPLSGRGGYDPNDILIQTTAYWECILAGLVLTQFVLRAIER